MKTVLTDLKYLVGYIVPLGTFVAIRFGGWHSYIVPFYAFVIIPLLEMVLPKVPTNLTTEQEQTKLANKFFDWLLYSNVLWQFLLLGYFLYTVTYGEHENWEILGMTLSMGISCGVLGINVAHELGHRVNKGEQLLAKMLLLSSLYMHFYVEHNRGHHKNVSTDLDPASARKGEMIYVFFFRTIFGSFRSAWNLEKLRLSQSGQSAWSLRNEVLVFQLIQAAFTASIFLAFGWRTGLLFMAAALIGILLLETVNYVEHYGLRRREVEPGIYEKVKPYHSWNSDHILGRIMLYELTRHSDHHYKATRKYQVLRHFDESPQLPLGYPGSMVMAWLPPLWFYVMNRQVKRVEQQYAAV